MNSSKAVSLAGNVGSRNSPRNSICTRSFSSLSSPKLDRIPLQNLDNGIAVVSSLRNENAEELKKQLYRQNCKVLVVNEIVKRHFIDQYCQNLFSKAYSLQLIIFYEECMQEMEHEFIGRKGPSLQALIYRGPNLQSLVQKYFGFVESKEFNFSSIPFEVARKILSMRIINNLVNFNVETASKLFATSKKYRIPLDSSAYRAFFRYFFRNHDLDSVEKLKSQILYSPEGFNKGICRTLLEGYFKHGYLEGLDSVLSDMRTREISFDLPIYNILIAGFGRLRDAEKMNYYFDLLMADSSTSPDIETFNGLLTFYLYSPEHAEKATMILQQIEECGLSYSENTFYVLLEASLLQKRYEDFVALVAQMTKQKSTLAIHNFTSLMKICMTNGFNPGVYIIHSAINESLLHSAKSNWDVAACSLLLKFYLKHEKYDFVDEIFQIMKTNLIPPNFITYSTLLEHFAERCDIGKVLEIVNEMKERSVPINGRIKSILTKFFYSQVRIYGASLLRRMDLTVDDCKKVTLHPSSQPLSLEHMKTSFEALFPSIPFTISIHHFNEALIYYFRCFQFENFDRTLLKIAEYNLQPNILTMALRMKRYIFSLQLDEARKVIMEEMPKVGLNPKLMHAAYLFHAYCRRGYTEEAEKFMFEMQHRFKIEPNYIFYSSLLYSYSKRNDFVNLFRIFDVIEKKGFSMDTETGNYVMFALFDIGEKEQGMKFFEKLSNLAVPKNIFTFAILCEKIISFQGCESEEEKAKDLEFLRRALREGLKENNGINGDPFHRLASYHYRNGQMNEMYDVIEEMVEIQVQFTETTFPYLILTINHLMSLETEESYKKALIMLEKLIHDVDFYMEKIIEIFDFMEKRLAWKDNLLAELLALRQFYHRKHQ